ncbi:MAG: Cell division protein FtsZ [Candidatus Tokpelaia hoelldobleri]|uniref:Cell division protein FtsZ n=1 Tax=Candidatus Tokpelaia hoelldobleri TaxID=1902579 RepID=A0A1U9JVV5_9HYPH|nr:MAG: Cell division protein FtsZ [Candidatus Tokpelaia hoelldoblerii]
MTINLQRPDITELRPRISVIGVGGGGGNAVNNMINAGLEGVDFIVANTDAQALTLSRADRVIQLGVAVTRGLGAGSHPEVGRAAAEECLDEILDHLADSHMVFVTAGMGGGTGTGAAPVIARAAREKGILTVGVVTKPFEFEGQGRMRAADAGVMELQKSVDTLIVIPNQNLLRIVTNQTALTDSFAMADHVLYDGVASITNVMMKPGLINLDYADVKSIMHDMGKAMMGTGEATGEDRALKAAEAAIANPLLDETSMNGARGLLISITGGRDITLFEVDTAVSRVREEVDSSANVIFGTIIDEALEGEGVFRVSVVATGVDSSMADNRPVEKEDAANARYNQPIITTPAAAPDAGKAALETTTVAEEKTAEKDVRDQEIDVILEALEEEMSAPAEEIFQPQSRIFTKTPVDVNEAPAAKAAIPAQSLNKPVASTRAGGARIPEIEDFPPALRQNAKSKARQDDVETQGPRSLWQKITQGFLHHDEEDEPVARLEPVSQVAQPVPEQRHENNRPAASDRAIYAPRRAAPQNTPPQRVKPQAAEMEDEKLEIPAFLRRQVN